MSIAVTASPNDLSLFREPAASFTEEPDDAEPPRAIDTLRARLQVGYLERVEAYKTELLRAQRNNLSAGDGFPQSQYPTLELRFKDDNGADVEFDIPIDEDLWTTLFDLFAYYGPRGLLLAEDELDKYGYETNDRTWMPATLFFYYTVNSLNLLIREALINLEEAATGIMALKLGASARFAVSAYRDEFGFRQVAERREVVYGRTEREVLHITYRMSAEKAEFKETVFATLKEAVTAKEVYEQRVKKAREVRQEAESLRQTRALSPSPVGSPGFRTPYDDNRDARPSQELAEKAESAMADATRAESDEAAARALLDAISTNVFYNSPAALLGLPKLSPGFTEEDMQDAIGGWLYEFYGRVDKIGTSLANPSTVSSATPGLKDGATLAGQRLESLFPTQYSLMHSLARKAIDDVDDNQRCYALLAVSIWQEICAREDMDAFEYIVARQWLATVDEVLDDIRVSEARWRRFWQSIGLAASALSLAELAIRSPQAAAAVATVRITADVLVLLHAIYSVGTQLESLDVATGQEVIAFNLEGMTGMMRLVNILNDRREFRDQIVLGLASELALLPFARFRAVKRLMALRGYYQDIDTLFGPT